MNHGITEYSEKEFVELAAVVGHEEGRMFLVEERRNGQRRAEIYMRPDGLFEGRIYRQEAPTANDRVLAGAEFEVCGVTETLPRVETIVDEELGL